MTEPEIRQAVLPPWHVYMLRTAAGHLYTGISTEPQRRLLQHEGGKLGARSLRGIFEELETPILYVVPDQPEIRKVAITSLFAGPTVTRGN